MTEELFYNNIIFLTLTAMKPAINKSLYLAHIIMRIIQF